MFHQFDIQETYLELDWTDDMEVVVRRDSVSAEHGDDVDYDSAEERLSTISMRWSNSAENDNNIDLLDLESVVWKWEEGKSWNDS